MTFALRLMTVFIFFAPRRSTNTCGIYNLPKTERGARIIANEKVSVFIMIGASKNTVIFIQSYPNGARQHATLTCSASPFLN